MIPANKYRPVKGRATGGGITENFGIATTIYVGLDKLHAEAPTISFDQLEDLQVDDVLGLQLNGGTEEFYTVKELYRKPGFYKARALVEKREKPISA